MTHQLSDVKETVVVAVKNWRDADKNAIANKRDRDAQRTEYEQRSNLRNAADKLEAHHG